MTDVPQVHGLLIETGTPSLSLEVHSLGRGRREGGGREGGMGEEEQSGRRQGRKWKEGGKGQGKQGA